MRHCGPMSVTQLPMSVLTQAEILFEKYCTDHGIPFTRIPEGLTRTPDYELVLGGGAVAVEVKQLDPNEEDRAFLHDLRTKGRAGGMVDMGRAWQSIQDAVKQLRRYAKGRMPAVVLLYNSMGSAIPHLDPYNLAYCLYGPEKVHYAVPADPHLDVRQLGMSRGGGSLATKQHNTTLSAIAVLQHISADEVGLSVYHNIHASTPLRPAQCEVHGIRQYKFEQPGPGLMPDWRQL